MRQKSLVVVIAQNENYRLLWRSGFHLLSEEGGRRCSLSKSNAPGCDREGERSFTNRQTESVVKFRHPTTPHPISTRHLKPQHSKTIMKSYRSPSFHYEITKCGLTSFVNTTNNPSLYVSIRTKRLICLNLNLSYFPCWSWRIICLDCNNNAFYQTNRIWTQIRLIFRILRMIPHSFCFLSDEQNFNLLNSSYFSYWSWRIIRLLYASIKWTNFAVKFECFRYLSWCI